jgi:nucleoside-diphosphate-sugar epimerase
MVSRDAPLAIVNANILGTANILELARKSGAKKFIYCSSTSVYGEVHGTSPIDEHAKLQPTSVYGASKAAGELLVAAYARQYGVAGISLRISTVYGPRRKNFCAIREIVKAGVTQTPLSLNYGKSYERQYIHVDDAVAAILGSLNAPIPGYSVFNATGGTCMTLEQIAALAQTMFPSLVVEIGPEPDPLEDIQDRFSIEAASHQIGYQPSISLESGMKQLAEAILKNS